MTFKKVSLIVNYEPIQVSGFVQRLIKSVIESILCSLKEHGEAGNVKLLINEDTVEITVGNDTLRLNPFVSNFLKNTVIGMISSLKGIESVEKLEINIS